MTDSKKMYLVEKYKGNISESDLATIRDELDRTDDDKFEVLNAIKIKSKTVTVLLSVFLSVFARFYLGDIGFGIFRIIACIALSLLALLPIMNIISGIALVIWYIVEIVLCLKRVKYINYTTIRTILK